MRGSKDPNTSKYGAIIGLPAKRHLNGTLKLIKMVAILDLEGIRGRFIFILQKY